MVQLVDEYFEALDAAHYIDRRLAKYDGITAERVKERNEAWRKVNALRTKLMMDGTAKAPENEVHKAISGFLSKRDQGRVMQVFRDFDLVYNPRDADRQTRKENNDV